MENNNGLTLPNFICIGAQKTGTTSLYHILKAHPEITVSEPRKETKFFYRDEEYKLGLEFYSHFFEHGKNAKAIGEFDPDYLFFPYVPERIYKNLGADMKFIVMFRNPVDRAYSQYNMSVRKGFENLSFEDALLKEKERLRSVNITEQNNFSYISRGQYDEQLKRYFNFFPKENFLFINYDDEFQNDLQGTLKKIFHFLGVAEIELDINIKANSATEAKSTTLNKLVRKKSSLRNLAAMMVPSAELRRKIRKRIIKWNKKETTVAPLSDNLREALYHRYFEESITQLEKTVGRNFASWKVEPVNHEQ